MCMLCEERFASASKDVDEIVASQEEYREQVPKRTQGQRVSDLANVILAQVPVPLQTDPKVVEVLQSTALYLAVMTERVMEMKRGERVR